MNNKITLNYIAGYCPEDAIWKLIIDISNVLLTDDVSHYELSPERIIVDGDSFLIENVGNVNKLFHAPEYNEGHQPTEAELIWSLGAMIYFVSSGHIIFGGFGGQYQKDHPAVPLPCLQKLHHSITPIMHKCLKYDPTKRISLRLLNELAQKGLADCQCQKRVIKPSRQDNTNVISIEVNNWPEEMKEV